MRMSKQWLLVAGAVAVAGLLAAQAQSGLLGTLSITAAPKAKADAIKVHGQWTIVVRSKSGKVVKRRTFHNDLTNNGARTLAQSLAGLSSPGRWVVALTNSGGPQNVINGGPCGTTDRPIGPDGDPCYIKESTADLTVTAPTAGADANKLVLAGEVEALVAGSINRVFSLVGACGGSVPPDSCNTEQTSLLIFTFSSRGITPVSVAAGQSIDVTVKFTFS